MENLPSVTSPIGLAGVTVTVFLLAFKAALKSGSFGKISGKGTERIFEKIFNRLFILALFCSILGFLGYIFPDFEKITQKTLIRIIERVTPTSDQQSSQETQLIILDVVDEKIPQVEQLYDNERNKEGQSLNLPSEASAKESPPLNISYDEEASHRSGIKNTTHLESVQGSSKNYHFLAGRNYVGIPSERFEAIAPEKKELSYAYAACIQMVLDSYGFKVSQEDVLLQIAVYKIFSNLFGEESGSGFLKTIDGWKLPKHDRSFIVKSELFERSLHPVSIIKQLSQNRPVIFAYSSNEDTLHILVLTAVSFIVDSYGKPFITSIVVYDPYSDDLNTRSKGLREYPSKQFTSNIQWMHLITVVPESSSEPVGIVNDGAAPHRD